VGLLAWLVGWFLRLPTAGEAVPVRLHIDAAGDSLVWRRSFASAVLTSRQRVRAPWLVETFGPFAIAFFVVGDADGLRYQQQRFGVRVGPWPLWLPRFLGPSVSADCRAAGDGAAQISVTMRVPLVGTVLSYSGEIKRLGGP